MNFTVFGKCKCCTIYFHLIYFVLMVSVRCENTTDLDGVFIPRKMYDILHDMLQKQIADKQQKDQAKDFECRIAALESKISTLEDQREDLKRYSELTTDALKRLMKLEEKTDSVKNALQRLSAGQQQTESTCKPETNKTEAMARDLKNVKSGLFYLKCQISTIKSDIRDLQQEGQLVQSSVSTINETLTKFYANVKKTDQIILSGMQTLSASFVQNRNAMQQVIEETKNQILTKAVDLIVGYDKLTRNNANFKTSTLKQELLKISNGVTDPTLENIISLPEKHRCPESWMESNGHCYFVSNNELNWQSSADHCKKLRGHLVIVDSREENTFLQQLAKDMRVSFWLDGTDAKNDNIWIWSTTGRRLTFTDWTSGDPDGGKNQNCLAMHRQYNFKWVDAPCSEKYHFVCEAAVADS